MKTSPPTTSRDFRYSSMGTEWNISFFETLDESRFASVRDDIMHMSEEFDRTYSRFIKSSLVWNIAANAGTYTVPEDFIRMLRWYVALYEASDRKLNPLIGFTISDMGYDADYSLVPREVIRDTPDLSAAVRIIDDSHIETMVPVLFDFGALGKGFFVDRIASYLQGCSVSHFLVDGSGDIYYAGPGAISAGLEDPRDESKVIGVVAMQEGAMCASGVNRRRWNTYHHVIDPQTNESTQGILATWVLAPHATMADALASCLFFVAPDALATAYPFEYCVMNDEGLIKKSAGFRFEE